MPRSMPRLVIPALLLSASLALTGCKSPEERAAEYFASAQDYIAQGDIDRALIELRNVFQNDGFHKDARKTYADLVRERGNITEAYSQYLLLVEQYPDTPEVRLILAEMAFASNNWDEVERHGKAAIALAPQEPGIKAIDLALKYRDAMLERATVRASDIAAEAEAELANQPDNLVLRQLVIDQLLQGPVPADAMPHVDAALELEPENFRYNSIKLRLLVLAEDMAGIGDQLKIMVKRFPDNVETKQSLIRWYVSEQDFDGAEAFLRSQAAGEENTLTGDTAPHLDVVRFLNQTKGRDAGRAELERLIAANKGTANAQLYAAFAATMDFEDGDSDAAIVALDEILKEAEPSDQTRNIMAMQARILISTGEVDRAKKLVTSILEEDGTNVDGLKMRATWAIGEDRPGDAIVDLRTARGQAPQDPQIMTLLAAAFERDGSIDLAGEQLAQAVDASNSGIEESLRYATFLRGQGRQSVAETVLIEAQRASRNNPQILRALSEVFLAQEKWEEAQEMADALRATGDEELAKTAESIDAAILFGQERFDEAIGVLEEQAASSDGDVRPVITVVAGQVRAGKLEQARTYLDGEVAKQPDNDALQLLSANLDGLMGRAEPAEKTLRALIARRPGLEPPVRLLYGLLRSSNRADEAAELIDSALEAAPDDRSLLWIKAGLLEEKDAFDEAITVHERIYALDSSNMIAANNLASMLSAHREDAASLDRAFAIARRLRESDVPAFQDTYGWIEYRRGNVEEALQYLEPGAKGLPEDPLAQFHLGMAYADLGRKDEAIAQFQRMLELAAERNLPQVERAKARIAELNAAPASE